MHAFPHLYHVSGSADPTSTVTLASAGLPNLATTPPPEFGGPEGNWSPETLLAASVADCFILTFRAIAAASKLDWTTIECDVKGTLDRVEGVTRFTRFDLAARLTVPEGTDVDKADKLMHKSEAMCLITASLRTENHLETEITTA
ncbi:MAG: OsmC family protein [Xanthomonadales bacterium]|jgi:organic hydroperoxide reductase OsmC/OhrA|nr:OsmC family protein [Xanthomonadales bacterium]